MLIQRGGEDYPQLLRDGFIDIARVVDTALHSSVLIHKRIQI